MSGGMGSFGIFPLAEAFSGKPRMYARFCRFILLKEKELPILVRARVRGSVANEPTRGLQAIYGD